MYRYRLVGTNGYRSYTVGSYDTLEEAETAQREERKRLRSCKVNGIKLRIQH